MKPRFISVWFSQACVAIALLSLLGLVWDAYRFHSYEPNRTIQAQASAPQAKPILALLRRLTLRKPSVAPGAATP